MTIADFLEKHVDGLEALIALAVIVLLGWLVNHE